MHRWKKVKNACLFFISYNFIMTNCCINISEYLKSTLTSSIPLEYERVSLEIDVCPSNPL